MMVRHGIFGDGGCSAQCKGKGRRVAEQLSPQVTIQWDGQGVGLKSENGKWARRVAKGTEIEEFLRFQRRHTEMYISRHVDACMMYTYFWVVFIR